MAKRLIDTELWNNEEIIENFTAEDKYFWLYLLTSPHNNICGVFKNSPTLIARDMGLHKDTIVNLLYRFEKVHNLIFADKETNEILILNWYKWNWTKSPKILTMVEKEINSLKSVKLIELLEERIGLIFEDKDTVSIGYRYPTNSISISNNINIVTNEEIDTYFDKIYSIYPRKVSKVQAKETFEHKLRGLEKEEAYKKAIAIYRMLENQNKVWQAENDGQGRKVEHIPHFSTWANDNVENSPHFKKGRKR
jgi:hypothetical protein